ncbi:hypothetical protein TCAL_11057 [Tigriopus californicus]|uniref:Large ribosomal subunit protein mL40 n=1 Tax=Tigriopus californicus TaxID=6832 RepID=A0A553PJS4_TIGCA|nr:large ribosomal subunit protein mL40-like [Tigriopus californicus]TRY77936.1 hypothetical protein TCAL_11057 [Tigriopus californicus]
MSVWALYSGLTRAPLWRTWSHAWAPASVSGLGLHTSGPLAMLPGKKKKRMDPALEKFKDERKIKRLTKALKKMQKKDRILKPVLEVEVPPHLVKEKVQRDRGTEVPYEIQEERILLGKQWSRFCGNRNRKEVRQFDNVILSQQKALDVLKTLSPALHFEAIQHDPTLLPFKAKGPVYTLPIPEYIQDGEYKDVTKEFTIKYGDMKQFMTQLISNPRRRSKKQTDES